MPRFDRTGRVLERLPHDSFLVKVDGSGRITQRTRKHLRPIQVEMRLVAPLPASAPSTTTSAREPSGSSDDSTPSGEN